MVHISLLKQNLSMTITSVHILTQICMWGEELHVYPTVSNITYLYTDFCRTQKTLKGESLYGIHVNIKSKVHYSESDGVLTINIPNSLSLLHSAIM